MKKIYILLIYVVCSGVSNYISAQTLTNYARQHKLEVAERQRMERTNYEKACKEGTIAALKQYLSMYPKGKYIQDVKSRITEIEMKNEKDMYDSACRVETSQAYHAYLKKYPNGRYAQEAEGRIEDMELWKRTKTDNTISAYRYYLSASRTKSFAELANDAIKDIESKDAWNLIRNSSYRSDIESFVGKYPKSSCLPEAKRKLNELTAVELYRQGKYQSAIDKFEAAGGRSSIDYSNRSKYDDCVEYLEYRKLNSSSKESDLKAYIKRFPSSKYNNQVSNYLAIVKAKQFSMYSGSYIFNEALSYAKDQTTRNIVQSYIDNSKKLYRKYERALRHNKIMANGGYVQIGLELFDIGLNSLSSSYEYDRVEMFYYNMGISVKFGNYKSPIQFEMGMKPGFISAKYNTYETNSYYSYGYEYEEDELFFHMPLYAKLKLNICSAGNSKFYIAGLATYNAFREKKYESENSIGCGGGFAWRNWDWFVLYYKQDVSNNKHKDGNFWGSSLIYYFNSVY